MRMGNTNRRELFSKGCAKSSRQDKIKQIRGLQALFFSIICWNYVKLKDSFIQFDRLTE